MSYSQQSIVIQPATSSLLTTVDAVKAELGISTSTDDAFFSNLIRYASSQIALYCNQTFGIETRRDIFRQSRSNFDRYNDDDDGKAIWLKKTPIVSVTSITTDGSVLVADTDYILDPGSGCLMCLNGGDPTAWTMSLGTVEYVAGYVLPGSPNPTLPAALERACIDMVKLGFSNRSRDPQLRSEQIMDIVTRTWFSNTTPGSHGLPETVASQLDYFREAIIV